MKTLKLFCVVVVISLFTGFTGNAQTADVTIVVNGIKDAKGKIMIAMGDQLKPSEMKYDMVEVASTDDVTCVLKDVPVGISNLYVFQDLNENYQLDKDEKSIPVEPCFSKEKLDVKEGENKFEAKLVNVKEMIEGKK